MGKTKVKKGRDLILTLLNQKHEVAYEGSSLQISMLFSGIGLETLLFKCKLLKRTNKTDLKSLCKHRIQLRHGIKISQGMIEERR